MKTEEQKTNRKAERSAAEDRGGDRKKDVNTEKKQREGWKKGVNPEKKQREGWKKGVNPEKKQREGWKKGVNTEKKQREGRNRDRVTAAQALRQGDMLTKLSAIVMGAGLFFRGQRIKGLLVLACEVSFIGYIIGAGWQSLKMLPSLGVRESQKVWDEALQVFRFIPGDNSAHILLMGVVTCFAVAAIVLLWIMQLCHSYVLQEKKRNGEHIPSFIEDIRDLLDQHLHLTLMTLPVLGILVFNIVPLVYMISMAFTTYSRENDQLHLFKWNGLRQFVRVLNMKGNIGRQFWQVLLWTLIWAVLATFLNYILGMLLALLINRKGTRWKAFWRFCFVLSIAVPQFVTLMIMNIMLQPNGAVNVLLMNLGWTTQPLPFWTNAMWARVTIVIINLWVGVPYTMLQVTGILRNIPQELYEAASIDGAGPVQTFFKITLPYMLFVTAPALITSFVGNINNFNIIYLLSGGGPTYVGDTAGQTDLLVTWLYKLTITQRYYNIGAVIGILTFVILTVFTLLVYRNTNAYKDEEAFM